jgi:hypothetical protein
MTGPAPTAFPSPAVPTPPIQSGSPYAYTGNSSPSLTTPQPGPRHTNLSGGRNHRHAQGVHGEVQPAAAISLGAGGSYSFTVLLQASRLGTDLDGRHYTITVRASDNAGNSGSQANVVTVPHDQGD